MKVMTIISLILNLITTTLLCFMIYKQNNQRPIDPFHKPHCIEIGIRAHLDQVIKYNP